MYSDDCGGSCRYSGGGDGGSGDGGSDCSDGDKDCEDFVVVVVVVCGGNVSKLRVQLAKAIAVRDDLQHVQQRVCVWACVCLYVCAHMCKCVCVHVRGSPCVGVYMCVCLCVCTHACAHACICIWCMFVCVCLQAEVKELKEQLNMLEAATSLGALTSTSNPSTFADDSIADLGIRKTLDFSSPECTTRSALVSV